MIRYLNFVSNSNYFRDKVEVDVYLIRLSLFSYARFFFVLLLSFYVLVMLHDAL